ncbi:MAG: hypothetical protein JXL20_02075, partial [Deltaproteobacteria bacterium]|nr:hypothetical protein [Deltaproteobacteria bacterium]
MAFSHPLEKVGTDSDFESPLIREMTATAQTKTTGQIESANEAISAQEATYAERLGWPAGSKVVLFHVDDA